jgi:hypothetical protein
MTIDYSTEDGGWTGRHLTKVDPESGLTCPLCDVPVTHMQAIIMENDATLTEPRLRSWIIVPCAHEVLVQEWTLWFNGAGQGAFREKGEPCPWPTTPPTPGPTGHSDSNKGSSAPSAPPRSTESTG